MVNNKLTANSDRTIIIICSFLALVIFILDSLVPLGVAGGVPYILIILISLWAHRKNLPVYMAIAGSILTIIGFYSSPPGSELWKVLTNRALALFAIWVVTILSVQRRKFYEEKEKALQKIRVLSGLLPICASCKKIRDDKGYWNQIETYISNHSDTEFSHGICPDCAKELYSDLDI